MLLLIYNYLFLIPEMLTSYKLVDLQTRIDVAIEDKAAEAAVPGGDHAAP